MTNTPRFTVVHATDRRTYWIGGQRQALIIDAAETANRYALSHSTIAVGGGAAEHSHSREAEAFYVIAGTLRFRSKAKRSSSARAPCCTPSPGSNTASKRSAPSQPKS